MEDEYNLSTDLPRLLYIKNPAPDRESALKDLLDIYYSVVGERSIYLKSDPEAGLILYGEMDEVGETSDVNLAVMFLEYVISCDWPKPLSEAPTPFECFVKQIGEALLSQIEQREISIYNFDRVFRSLACICKSMEAEVDIQKSEDELLIEFDPCPIMIAAEKKGIMIEESRAHNILRSLCRYLVHVIDPMMKVEFRQTPDSKHLIRISAGKKYKASYIHIPSPPA